MASHYRLEHVYYSELIVDWLLCPDLRPSIIEPNYDLMREVFDEVWGSIRQEDLSRHFVLALKDKLLEMYGSTFFRGFTVPTIECGTWVTEATQGFPLTKQSIETLSRGGNIAVNWGPCQIRDCAIIKSELNFRVLTYYPCYRYTISGVRPVVGGDPEHYHHSKKIKTVVNEVAGHKEFLSFLTNNKEPFLKQLREMRNPVLFYLLEK